jgi:hypothetical protein
VVKLLVEDLDANLLERGSRSQQLSNDIRTFALLLYHPL